MTDPRVGASEMVSEEERLLKEAILAERHEATLWEAEMVKAARVDINAFMEFVPKDENGERLVQDPMHESWYRHIAYARAIGRSAGILSLWGGGKSVQMAGFSSYLIGRHPQIRIKVVSNNFDLAKERVGAVKAIIENNPDYAMVFPGIRPIRTSGQAKTNEKGQWSGSKFRVASLSGALDSTMEAKGVLSTGAGGRCDFLLIDDPHDYTNVVEKPAQMPKVLESIQNTWIPRVIKTGMVVLISTKWHEGDAMTDLMKNPGWVWLVQEVSSDYKTVESRMIVPGWGEQHLPPIPVAA